MKNGFVPCIFDDPNVFDYLPIEKLKSVVKIGQNNFQRLLKTGLVHDTDATNQQWYNHILLAMQCAPTQDEQTECQLIKGEFNKITQYIYDPQLAPVEIPDTNNGIVVSEELRTIGNNYIDTSY